MTAFMLSAALMMADEANLHKEVAAAREKAVGFLKKEQSKEGHWEGAMLNLLADMEGGVTALVTLSLLEAGVPTNDPAVTKAVEYLIRLEPKKTYVVSLQTRVLCRMDAKQHKETIQKNVDWLLKQTIQKDGKLHGWSYPGNQIADNSNTHFAVVALHAAAQAGAKVDAKVWKQIRDHYVRTQMTTGWDYYSDRAFGGAQASLSMTTCALVGLSIAVKYDPNAKGPDPAFEKGLPQMLKLDGGWKSEGYVWMTTAELGRTLGVAQFKAGNTTRAWYRDGTVKLMRTQNRDGSWVGTRGIDSNPILTTAFGLYFLGPPPEKK